MPPLSQLAPWMDQPCASQGRQFHCAQKETSGRLSLHAEASRTFPSRAGKTVTLNPGDVSPISQDNTELNKPVVTKLTHNTLLYSWAPPSGNLQNLMSSQMAACKFWISCEIQDGRSQIYEILQDPTCWCQGEQGREVSISCHNVLKHHDAHFEINKQQK